MKNTLLVFAVLLLSTSGASSQIHNSFIGKQVTEAILQSAINTGIGRSGDGPDEYLGEVRRRWQNQIHRAAPGVDWRKIEQENMLRKYERVLSARGSQSREIFANGRICGNWSERGSINQSGCAQGGDYDSTDNSLYVMGCNGNLFKGYADRCEWSPVNDNLKFSNQIIKVTRNANGGKRLLCNLGLNIYYSDDDGVTFQPASGILFPVSWAGNKFIQIETLSDSNQTLMLITRPWDGETWSPRYFLFTSTDHGQTWTKIFKFPYGEDYRIQMWVPFMQKNYSYILLNHDAGNISRLYKFDRQSSGVSLVNTSTDLPTNAYLQFAGYESGPSTVLYAISNYTLYKSLNRGLNWTRMVNAPTGMGVLDVSLSDPNKVVVGGVEAFRSMDGGNSWTMVNTWGEYYGNPLRKLHADIRKIKYYVQRDGSEFAIINCDGGTYRSDDFYVTVTNLSLAGLNIGQYYDGISDNQGRLFLGSQDQGFQRADSTITRRGLLSFQQVISGDYGNLQLTRNKQTLWSQYPGGNMYYCYNSMGPINRSWSLPGTTKPLSSWMLATAPIFPSYKNEILLGGGNLNGGPGSYLVRLSGTPTSFSPSQINYDFRGGTNFGIAAIGTTPADTNVIYVAREDGSFYYSTNAGQSWTRTSGFSGPTPLYLYGTCILASQKTRNLLWYAGSGYSNPGVYKSTDGGATFAPMATGLPSTLVYRIAANSSESMLFAATEAGPYVYVNADNQWYPLDNGLAPAQNYWAVNFDSVANAVHFSTYGRGLWDFLIGSDTSSVSISVSENNVCAGSMVSFTASPVNGGLNPVYRWKKNGLIVGGNGQTYSTNTLVNGDAITCEMTSSFDCVNTGVPVFSNTILMTVKPLGISPSAGSNSPVCSGSNLNLTASGGVNYQWTGPNGFISNVQNPVISNSTSANSGSYSVTITASNGCRASAGVNATIEIPPSQPGTISVSGGSAAVCPGDTRIYSVPAVAGIYYNWTPPAGASITEGQGTNTIRLSFTSAFTSNGYLRVTGRNSCGISTARSLLISRNQPSPPSAISVSGGLSAVCPGDTRTYSVNLLPGIAYIWTAPRGAEIISGQGSHVIQINFTSLFTANGTLTVKASNNCGTSSSRSLTITRNLPSTPGAISGLTSVCSGSVTTYSINPVANALEYIWTVPAGSFVQGTANGNQINVLWGTSGGSITVKSKNNCGISSSRSISVSVKSCPVTAAGKETTGPLASVFPNPAKGVINISFNNDLPSRFSLGLFDASGREVISRTAFPVSKNDNYPLNVMAMPGGQYSLRVEDEHGNRQVIKVILE